MTRIRIQIRIHFFQCGSRIRIRSRIKIKWILSTEYKALFQLLIVALSGNIGPDRVSRFDVYWTQTDRQAKYIYRCWRFF